MNTSDKQAIHNKIKAAYALNLCTVSVSQIIDYNDFNILDQEYNVILNNLNLEEMPKDEALLHVIKQLLDTITYFRIDEVERKFIDDDYQYEMQNAIWNAIPQFGILFVGANPVTTLVSLATQVGTSYINYRRNKANALKNKEKAMWQLQKSAIEQFNGLRRELFDTAWRLADNYQFPDEYRLTENQIDQYDDILMDTNLIRRYERLNTIKDNFTAYPQFWYFFAHTAAEIAFDSSLHLNSDDRAFYIEKAKESFQTFYDSREFNLLRVNHIASAGALEYAALLNTVSDKPFIEELISYAVKKSGNANDILELCAMAYLKITELEKASELFSILVNESYNPKVNAQLLSSIYAKQALESDSSNRAVIQRKYNLLADSINQKYLFPLPESNFITDTLHSGEAEFIENQKDVLKKEFEYIIEEFFDHYSTQFNMIVPLPLAEMNPDTGNEMYSDSNLDDRLSAAKKFFTNSENRNNYKRWLCNTNYAGSIIDLLNELFENLMKLSFITNDERNTLWQQIRLELQLKGDRINNIIKTFNSPDDYSYEKYEYLQSVTLYSFIDFMQDELKEITNEHIENLTTVTDCADFEYDLQHFCTTTEIDPPEILIDAPVRNELIVNNNLFSVEMLGTQATSQDVITRITQDMADLIHKRKDSIIKPGNKQLRILVKNTDEFNQYFNSIKRSKDSSNLSYDAIAVIDDRSAFFPDIILTNQMVQLVIRGSVSAAVQYKHAVVSPDLKKLRIDKKEYTNKGIDMSSLRNLINELAEMSVPIAEARATSIKAVSNSKKQTKSEVITSKKFYWTK